MRAFLFCGAAAMTFVTSILPIAAYAKAPPAAKISPVQCAGGGDQDRLAIAGARGKSSGGYVSAPPPPVVAPPPPPPTPIMPVPQEKRMEYAAPPVQMNQTTGGLIAPPPPPVGQADPNRERYAGEAVSSVMRVAESPVSTFAVDVDTGAYANIRRMLNSGQMPPPAAVRTEELLNYFRYDYPLPQNRSRPFSITTNVAQTPWNSQSRLLRIGLRAYDVPRNERPAANLVFLIDVSGSMSSPDKLPLVKSALNVLAEQLRPDDRVSIVVYAGNAGLVLAPTSDGKYVKQALECLTAGGSTAGGAGIALAYATARANLIKDGINRVILCTDGDFNVGCHARRGPGATGQGQCQGRRHPDDAGLRHRQLQRSDDGAHRRYRQRQLRLCR